MSESLFSRILVAVDGSENSKKAVNIAIRVAEVSGATVDVVSVVPVPYRGTETDYAISSGQYEAMEKQAGQQAKNLVDETVSMLSRAGVKSSGHVLEGGISVVQEIIQFQEEQKADLVIVGTRGLGGFKKLLMGSVSSGVVSHATCAVLVVR